MQQILELGIAIQDLKVKSINECKAVKDLEIEADKIYQQAIKELFEKEKDAINLIKEKRNIRILGRTLQINASLQQMLFFPFLLKTLNRKKTLAYLNQTKLNKIS